MMIKLCFPLKTGEKLFVRIPIVFDEWAGTWRTEGNPRLEFEARTINELMRSIQADLPYRADLERTANEVLSEILTVKELELLRLRVR